MQMRRARRRAEINRMQHILERFAIENENWKLQSIKLIALQSQASGKRSKINVEIKIK